MSFTTDKIRLSPSHKYLVGKSGKPFLYLADTWWYGATSRTSWDSFKKLVALRSKQGFNAVQIVVGYPPEIDPHSVDASNSGGWPIINNKINEAYFVDVDKRINYLLTHKIVPVIFGSWGYHSHLIGERNITMLWDEIIRRYGKYNVIWSLAGEVDLAPSIFVIGSKTRSALIKPFIKIWKILKKIVSVKHNDNIKSQIKIWNNIAKHIKRKSDNLLTVHVHSKQTANELFSSPKWLDINTIQSGHDHSSIKFMRESALNNNSNLQPFINLEPWYEGIKNDFYADDQRLAFWAMMLSGAKGYSYGANGIWQMSTKNDPFLSHWGVSDWKDSLKYDGAKQLGLSKKWLEKLPWWLIEPLDNSLIDPIEVKPLTAKIKNTHKIIYFPVRRGSQNQVIVKIDNTYRYQVNNYNPLSLKLISKTIVSNSNSITITHRLKTDLLVSIVRLKK